MLIRSFHTFRKFLVFVVIFLPHFAISEVSVLFHFNNEEGFKKQDIWSFSILNNSSFSIQCILQIQLNSKDKNQILEVKSKEILLSPGLTSDFNSNIFSSNYRYFGNSISRDFEQSDLLPPNEYKICVSIISKTEPYTLSLDCDFIEIKPHLPIELVYPENKDEIETLYPLLRWTPLIPQDGITYNLMLAPVFGKSSPAEALARNSRFLDITNLTTNFIPYPLDAPKLEYGKYYSWQVIAYKGNIVEGVTDVWKFMPIKSKINLNTESDCYRIISKENNNGNYLFGHTIKFSYDNRSNDYGLNYLILDTKNGNKISNLPEIKLQKGINNIDIDIDDIKGINKKSSYLIEIRNNDLERYTLTFMCPQK